MFSPLVSRQVRYKRCVSYALEDGHGGDSNRCHRQQERSRRDRSSGVITTRFRNSGGISLIVRRFSLLGRSMMLVAVSLHAVAYWLRRRALKHRDCNNVTPQETPTW